MVLHQMTASSLVTTRSTKGALEVYARDLQSAPLRVLELKDIRHGRFSPDVTRSGLFTPIPPHVGHAATSEVVPTPTSPLEDNQEPMGGDDTSLPSIGQAETDLFAAPSEVPNAPDETLEVADADSSSCSSESETEQVILEMATSERPTNQWHPGCELFNIPGRSWCMLTRNLDIAEPLSAAGPLLESTSASLVSFSWRPRSVSNARKGQQPTAESEQVASASAAVKRARHS